MLWAGITGYLLGVFLLLLVPVQLEVLYKYDNKNERLVVKFRLPGDWCFWQLDTSSLHKRLPNWFFIIIDILQEKLQSNQYKGKENKIDKESNADKVNHDFGPARFLKLILSFLKKAGGIWRRFLARGTCQRFNLDLTFGTSEPATTAILYGSLWQLMALFYRNLLDRTKLNSKGLKLNIKPNFNGEYCQLDFHCIFTYRLGYIISAGLHLILILMQLVWQTRGVGQNVRTSH
ncbi:MAG: hypothetical protein PWP31_177 [Clostridia bacterium]|nr:hypothetical protein [Clostridia bacterium]